MHHCVPAARTAHRRLSIYAALTLLLTITAVLTAMTPAHARPSPHPGPGPASCVRRDTIVTLTNQPAQRPYRVAGWLCQPTARTSTVQLTIAGFTYAHTYYTGTATSTSWVTAALAHGDALYLIDRIGTGDSDRPPADQVTVTTEAHVTHQIVTALRDGRLGRYRHVVGVGHSYGSIVLAAEAARHSDLDALILTGKLFEYHQPGLDAFRSSLYPARDDPRFARTRVPDGYVTTPPGSRPGFFLNQATATLGAAAFEEAAKSTGTSGEIDTMTVDAYRADSRHLSVPILLAVGSRDSLFCSAELPCDTGRDLCRRSAGRYPPSTAVAATTLPGAGHALDLHAGAPRVFTAANQWITRTLTHTGPRPDVTTCQP